MDAKKIAGKYTYRIEWSEKDGEYVGLCAEFSSLSWLAATQVDALKGIQKLVKEVLADMKANKESFPEPLAMGAYSGQFKVFSREMATKAKKSRWHVDPGRAGSSTNRTPEEEP
jgi:predicted RNase H-like HicB family nuclease